MVFSFIKNVKELKWFCLQQNVKQLAANFQPYFFMSGLFG